jgi:hypothetical protein
MLPRTFTPYPVATQAHAAGCFTCAHFHGQFLAEHLVCEHRSGTQVIGTPKMGCTYWEREPGASGE